MVHLFQMYYMSSLQFHWIKCFGLYFLELHVSIIFLILQCVFLVWCFAPAQWNGSNMIYNRLIRPFVLRYQTKIDKAIDDATEVVKEGIYRFITP